MVSESNVNVTSIFFNTPSALKIKVVPDVNIASTKKRISYSFL